MRLRLGAVEDIRVLQEAGAPDLRARRHHRSGSRGRLSSHGGWRGLENAHCDDARRYRQDVTDSGLRGRGGAAFPAGIKWKTVLGTESAQKYIVCNADEGDSGTFSDRMLMEGDPLCLIEGMTIAGLAVGATRGYIYLRCEYPHAHRALNEAIANAYAAGYLGADIRGASRRFDLEVRLGAGAYICGEETSLLDSLEGKRGQVRFKPPLPAIKGLFGQPTVINNVITLATVPIILDKGARLLHATTASAGRAARCRCSSPATSSTRDWSKRHSASRCANCCTTMAAAHSRPSDARRSGRRPARRVLARVAVRHHCGLRGVRRGRRDARPRRNRRLRRHGRHARTGALRDGILLDRILRQMHAVPDRLDARRRGARPDPRRIERDKNIVVLNDLFETMTYGSLCAMGGLTPDPVRSALAAFSGGFRSLVPGAMLAEQSDRRRTTQTMLIAVHAMASRK